jgi:hypothetical protein
MSWVRNNTASDAVFAHWWDYGYWVQSIGNRATVTDGGNAISFWNYYIGRFVLTGDSSKECFDFLYTHNASYLLIDSSDMGKYGAFSQIGSDENFDRLSQGPITMISDPKQTQETKNETIRSYSIPAGDGKISISPIEEDIIFYKNESRVTLFKENSGLAGIVVKYFQDGDNLKFRQPTAVFYSQNQQISVPMRYMYYNGQFTDFETGINATAYVVQRIFNSGNGLQADNLGAAIYLSPRLMQGLLAQVYILDDPFKKWSSLRIVHNQPDFILAQLYGQGTNIGEFTYYDNVGLLGPIKIWHIDYTGKETVNPDYLLRTQPAYITWKF